MPFAKYSNSHWHESVKTLKHCVSSCLHPCSVTTSTSTTSKILSEQKHCSHCTTIWGKMWGYYIPGNKSENLAY